MAHRTQFYPKNPEKYAGDPTNIICRSSWEKFFAHYVDRNENVKKWHSEETIVPYESPIDNAMHRYYVDFTLEMNDGRVVLVEVKPFKETKPPTEPKKKTRKAVDRFQHECKTYLVNQAKWAFAREVAKRNGAEFVVFTENELRKFGMP